MVCKFFNCHDLYFWPINILEYTEMGVIGNNIFCTSCNRAVHEFIIIYILLNQSKMDINLLKFRCM